MWEVNSKPHHFHPRGEKIAFESSMNGDPKHDISILLKELLEKLFNEIRKID